MSTATVNLKLTDAAKAVETPHLSPTIAKILIARSPMHAWDAHRLGGNRRDEPTKAQTRGLVMESMLFNDDHKYVIVDAPDYRGKKAQEQRDAAIEMGRLPILAAEFASYARAANAWAGQCFDRGLSLEGETQVRLTWDQDGTPCKGFLDLLQCWDQSTTIIDLKTCQDASTAACEKAVANMGHDIQHAAYVAGMEAKYPDLAGRVRMLFLFCEVERPYGVNVVELAGTMRLVGKRKWDHAVKVWGECLRSGVFPSYSNEVTRIEARPWQLDSTLDLLSGGDDGGDV